MKLKEFLKPAKKKIFLFVILYVLIPFPLVFLFLPSGSSFSYAFFPFSAPVCLAVSILFIIEGGFSVALPFVSSLFYLIICYFFCCLIIFYTGRNKTATQRK